jgi:hypothetical protein
MTMPHRMTLVLALLCLTYAPRFQAAGVAAKEEKFDAYAEWRKGDALIVDGQRLKWQPKAKFKGAGAARDFASIPPGFEITGKAVRQPDGSLLATELTARPNGTQTYEAEVKNATGEMEAKWVKAGHVVEQDKDGKDVDMGRLHTSGADVDRVRGIITRLIPPYLKASDFRVYVVENKDWNAFACANGMIVVYDSLLHDTNDDEMAIVLGHELVHATHEHTRKQIQSSRSPLKMALGVAAGVAGGEAGRIAQGVALATAVTYSALQSGYSRDHEDQADRVGLRYAYEGGFDVKQGPKLWTRFAEKYGSQDAVTNYLFGDHSRAESRAKNLTREIAMNYPTAK